MKIIKLGGTLILEAAKWALQPRRIKGVQSLFWLSYQLVFLGLITGFGIGIGDNGDGWRITEGAGLKPVTGNAAWLGYVVTNFIDYSGPNINELIQGFTYPTLNSFALGVANLFVGNVSLNALGWLYLGLGLFIIWGAPRNASSAHISIALIALCLAPFARFSNSTYADTPAFFGLVIVIISIAALVTTSSPKNTEKNLFYFTVGAVLISFSKGAYLPAVVVAYMIWALVFFYVVPEKRSPVKLAAVGMIAVTGVSVCLGLSMTQLSSADRKMAEPMNSHNFVMTIAIPHLPLRVVEDAGVPTNLVRYSGEGYWPRGDWSQIEGWAETFTTSEIANRLRLQVLLHPQVAFLMLEEALVASGDPRLSYLPYKTWTTKTTPEGAGLATTFFNLTNQVTLGLLTVFRWGLGGLFLEILLIIGSAGLALRSSSHPSFLGIKQIAPWAALLLSTGSIGLLLAGVAIIGDGTFEIEKHLIASSFLFSIQILTASVISTQVIWFQLSRVIIRVVGRQSGRSRITDGS